MAINALQLYFEPLSQFFKGRYCCGSQILRLSWLTVLVRAVFSAVLKDYKHSATLCNQINGDLSLTFRI